MDHLRAGGWGQLGGWGPVRVARCSGSGGGNDLPDFGWFQLGNLEDSPE